MASSTLFRSFSKPVFCGQRDRNIIWIAQRLADPSDSSTPLSIQPPGKKLIADVQRGQIFRSVLLNFGLRATSFEPRRTGARNQTEQPGSQTTLDRPKVRERETVVRDAVALKPPILTNFFHFFFETGTPSRTSTEAYHWALMNLTTPNLH